MKVFIGSSKESRGIMDEIANVLEEYEIIPICWNKPGLFLAGNYVIEGLIEISNDVDAAIFIYAEDDQIWYRDGITTTPRDNVIFEHGIFVAKFGSKGAIIIKHKDPKILSDNSGLIYIDYSEGKKALGKLAIKAWLENIKKEKRSSNNITVNNEAILSLNEYYNRIQKENNLSFYIHNNITGVIIKKSKDYPEYYVRNLTRYYRVVSLLNTNEKCEFDFKFFCGFKIKGALNSLEHLISKNLLQLNIKIGSDSYNLNDAVCRENKQSDFSNINISASKKIIVKQFVDISIKMKTLVSENMTVEMFASRYPTRGCSLSFEHDANLKSDFHWFKTNVHMEEEDSGIQKFDNITENGFQTYTNDWLLVGEGIVLHLFK